ncbi:MAG: hypothetical protein V1809_10125 [Planctomycetota bacterium]
MNANVGISSDQWLSRPIRGLLYKEWLAHRNLIVGFWAAWLVCVPVLMIFHHPAWIFGFGLLYAILAAPRMGGMDAAEGSEEFAFSLPATRSEIYITRLALGGGNLLAMILAGLLCIRGNLPQMIWGIFVQSGFTEEFPAVSGNWYAFAFAAPAAVFAGAFGCAILARSRSAVGLSWLGGALLAGIVAGGGLIAEAIVWGRVTSFISVPLLLIFSAGGLVLGYYRFTRKEGISRPAPVRGGSRWWVWVVVAVVILLLMSVISFRSVSKRPAGPPIRIESQVPRPPTAHPVSPVEEGR